MMKLLLTAVAAAALLAPGARALDVGDPAPELKLTKILKGEKVDASLKESGEISVVEFWATWCGPCRQSIPHLTELQKKYKDKNVRIIGITDEAEEQVAGFVEGQGDAMAYTVALDDGKKTWESYAVPFGLTGIPHAFIVDAAGTLLWHGHPLDGMDDVLAKVVEGEYDVAAARAESEKGALQEELGELTMLWAQEYLVLAKYGRDEAGADAIGKKLLECGYNDPVFYGQMAWTLLTSTGLAYKDTDYALKVATFANEMAEGKSADVLDTLALAQFESGQLEKAVATQKRAIELCDNEELMAQLKERLARYESS